MNWGHRIHFLEGVQGTDWQLQEKSAVFINDGGSSKCEHLYGDEDSAGRNIWARGWMSEFEDPSPVG